MKSLRTIIFFSLMFAPACIGISDQAVRTASGAQWLILWAWERPENLKFIDPQQTGVAFLTQTLSIKNNSLISITRKQPLIIPDGTYLIAVTRIETERNEPVQKDDDLALEIAEKIATTQNLKDVKGIQIDFDAVETERDFYKNIIAGVRKKIGNGILLSITALASWCSEDLWLGNLPVDEAVPMLFDMGKDKVKIISYLHNGLEWREPLCRGSYGFSVDQPVGFDPKPDRRLYFFNKRSWKATDLDQIKNDLMDEGS